MAGSNGRDAPAVVLVGPPSSGKTTIGRALASELAQPLLETDAMVAAIAGMPVADVFLLRGEAEFRRLESRAVLAGLAEHPGVLVLGSGAVLDPEVRAALSGVFVVELQLPALQAAKRAGITGARPVELGNVRSQWIRLHEERAPLYAEVADLRVDTAGTDVAGAVSTIVRALSDVRALPNREPGDPAPSGAIAPTSPEHSRTPPASPTTPSAATTATIDAEHSR